MTKENFDGVLIIQTNLNIDTLKYYKTKQQTLHGTTKPNIAVCSSTEHIVTLRG